ncbi:MAG: hypothetical protein EBZ69_06975 [Alphaproteobacteria bacterium]|nr:hypothetical protein [Alphaproteobacteria bacterium]NDC56536.1 hypothetical protein [Alphaproteobacteria bacterium]NDG04761.1 hypothetical protein [Alphaproteobacteria bacterium]
MDNLNAIASVVRPQAAEAYMALSKKSGASVDATAKDFEAMVASQLFSPMLNTMEVDPVFGGGEGEESFRVFLVQEYGRIAAETGSLNIAPHMKDMMLRMQHEGEQS